MTVRLFYNPDCSKCRGALDLLQEQSVPTELVEYLQAPPTREQIEEVLGLLGIGPHALVRTSEPLYAELGLEDADDDALLDAMTAHPILIQRPIAIANGRAVIGRPPERVLSILT